MNHKRPIKKINFNFLATGCLVILLIIAFGALFIHERKRSLGTLCVVSVSILSIFILAIYLLLPEIVAAYEVRFNPGVFEKPIGIVGEVTISDNGDMLFIIKKCKNHKVFLPIRYDGGKYISGTEVIAYGKMEWNEMGEYCFCANKITTKNDDLRGSLIYFARKIFERPRKWIYAHCPKCTDLKNNLFRKG